VNVTLFEKGGGVVIGVIKLRVSPTDYGRHEICFDWDLYERREI
jgi:hypothetical protein